MPYVLIMMNKYQYNLRIGHGMTGRNILKYLRRTREMFLICGEFERKLSVIYYTNVNFQID